MRLIVNYVQQSINERKLNRIFSRQKFSGISYYLHPYDRINKDSTTRCIVFIIEPSYEISWCTLYAKARCPGYTGKSSRPKHAILYCAVCRNVQSIVWVPVNLVKHSKTPIACASCRVNRSIFMWSYIFWTWVSLIDWLIISSI